jgi:Polyketide cyclase / dehydrase and lipid transport
MKTWLAVLGVLALVVVACSPKLEEGDVLEKNGDTFTVRLSKTIDEPIDKVWKSLETPEQLEKYSDSYEQTKLVKEEGNTKVLDYRVRALGQLQAFTMELTLQPDAKKVELKTLESSLADIQGSYELKPGPDGKSTIITYKATQKDKRNIPAPVSVQKTAIKDLFDDLVAGIKKGIQAGQG